MRWVVFDNETKKYASDVGGWKDFLGMGFSWAEAWDSATGEFSSFLESDLEMLAGLLESADIVVGKNITGFDLPHLEAHLGRRLSLRRVWDLQEEVAACVGAKIKLEDLSRATLGEGKIGGGSGETVKTLLAKGATARLASYCRRDVRLTRDLALFAAKYGYLLAPPCERIPLSFPGGVPPFYQEIAPPSKEQIRRLRSLSLPIPQVAWKASAMIHEAVKQGK